MQMDESKLHAHTIRTMVKTLINFFFFLLCMELSVSELSHQMSFSLHCMKTGPLPSYLFWLKSE